MREEKDRVAFRACTALQEEDQRVNIRRIYLKERRRESPVITKPNEYIKYIEGIRHSLKQKCILKERENKGE